MIRSFNGLTPKIVDSAYMDEAAVVTGDVVVNDGAIVWPNTTLRGDHEQIVVGERANVQDNAVAHEDSMLGPETTVGHSAIIHAATVNESALIGMSPI